MRHVNSFLLSLVFAPAVWALTGFGLVAYGRAGTHPAGELGPDRMAALVALALAGVMVAVLTVSRLSPVGPTLTGLAYLGAAGWAASYPVSVHRWVRDLGVPFATELVRPAEGYAVLLGVPLVATALSPARWRRFTGLAALYARPASPAPPVPASPAVPAHAYPAPPAPGYSVPLSYSGPPGSVWQPPPGWPPAPNGATSTAPRTNPARNADTEDLTVALLPLRSPHPPAG